jgi:flagellar export protein FliJ
MAVSAAVVNQLQDSLRELNNQLQANADAVRAHLMGKLDMQYLAAHRRFTGSMQKKGNEIVQQIAVAQKKVDEARARLIAAATKRKAIEALRDKQLDRWKADQSRRELAATDEIANQLTRQSLEEDLGQDLLAEIAATADNNGELP